ncbi:MAG TPA: hybrid sensor histidine kinase/response regulator, partial [Algoriphagus sp.]|nr:hybrid sensor histidine kinase/response regulator [Algoriphagus sp.]
AKTSHAHQIEGYESGADDYVTKPFQLDLLVLKIQNLLKTRRKLQNQLAQDLMFEPSRVSLSSPDEKFFEEAILIVEKYMDDGEFGVQVLVKELGLSRTLVFEKFKGLIGKTPNEFIQMIRMKRAAQLIQDGNLKINEVAFMVG